MPLDWESLGNTGARLAVVNNEHGEKFKASFWVVWRQIPDSARLLLETRWMSGCDIYLVERWSGCERRLADCHFGGTRLHFKASIVGRLPDRLVEAVVGHELAHALLYLTGDPYHCEARFGQRAARRLAEVLTEELTRIWRFQQDELRQWCNENSFEL